MAAAKSGLLGNIAVSVLEGFIEEVLEAKQGDKILKGKAIVKTAKEGKFVVEFAKLLGKKRTLTIVSE